MTTRTHEFRATVWQMTLMGLRYLNGRRLRTVLTTLAIVFGVALIFAINLVLPSVLSTFQQTLTTVTGADISVTSVSGESIAPDPIMEQVAAVEGVRAVSGILNRQFNLPNIGNGETFGSVTQINLIGIDPESIQQVRQFAMSEGRFLQPDDSGSALLPAGFADFAPELEIGTRFPLISASGLKFYTVVGLLADQGDLSAPEILVNLPDAQAAFNQPGLINTIEVSIDAGADRDAVGAAILETLGDSFRLNTSTNASDTWAAAQIGFAVLQLMGLIALFLGAFLIFNTFRTVVVERRHDLALLRILGATRRQITLLILIESLIQGVLGTLLGLLLGYLLALGLTTAMSSIWTTYFSRADFVLHVNFTAVVGAALLGLATALVAGYIPARNAGRTPALEALRPATVASVQRAARWSLVAGIVIMALSVLLLLTGSKGAVGGAMLFLIGMVIAAPGLVIPASRLFSPLLTLWFAREGDLARGNLVRQPGRAAITGSTLMIGLAILVVMAALVTAIGSLVGGLADANFGSDILLMPQSIGIYNNIVGADESLATRLRELPDVETVASLRYSTGVSEGQSLQVMGIDPSGYPEVANFEFNQGEPETVFPALGSGRNAVITPLAQTALGLNVGDDFVIQTAEGAQTYRVAGVASDLLTFKIAVVFISQGNLAADFHKTEDVMLMINLTPGADSAAALAEVQAVADDYPQFTAHLTGEYRDELVKTSTSATSLFYAIALLILIPAALGLLNTLTINILERTREIGVVRAVGGSRSQVRRIVTGEALLLGIFGSAMGVLAGVAMSYGFIAAFGTIGWDVPYTFPVIGIIAAAVVGVMLALFASILPARSAAKLDIIRALQYE